MAKINAHGNRQVGPTLYTERTVEFDGEDEVYYEAWRLRTDGALLTRIISVTRADGRVTKHRSSTFRILGSFQSISSDTLRAFLVGKGATIVKEAR